MTKKQKGKKGDNEGKITCKGPRGGSCGKTVENNAEGGIECDLCLNWFHPAC